VNSKRNPIDVVIGWSSFSLFTFRKSSNKVKVLVRDSAHIETQFEILNREFEKEGLVHPNRNWWIERELEEYELADAIFVLSKFAYNSFIKRGIPARKLHILPLGIDTTTFRNTTERQIELPLRVIYFGSISLRKGIPYLLDAFEKIPKDIANLTFIGNIEPSMHNRIKQLKNYNIIPRQKHQQLKATLQNYDIFVLPSCEDGFATVVPQALGCGLYPIVTENVGSSDLLLNENIGKVVPAFSSDGIIDSITEIAGRLNWFNQNRKALTGLHQSWSWARYDEALKKHMESILQPERRAAVGE
jgi:glycosyltransferase involved in cell wall biosynthesis